MGVFAPLRDLLLPGLDLFLFTVSTLHQLLRHLHDVI